MRGAEHYLREAEGRLKAAEDLVRAGDYKDSINRAYYAMFHAARALLLTRDLSPKTHEGLISLFGRDFVKSGVVEEEYGRILRRTEDMREKADYGGIEEVGMEVAERVLRDARRFVERMNEAVGRLKRP